MSPRLRDQNRDKGQGADARRQARQSWPVAWHRLGAEPCDDLSDVTTPAERIAMMWPLALEAWRLAGRPMPTYGRDAIPSRIFRRGEAPPDDDGPR